MGSFHGFSVGSTRACFRGGRKYSLPRTALNTSVRNVITLTGRCLRNLVSMPFGSRDLQNLSPLVACRTYEELVNFDLHEGTCCYAHVASSTISINCCVRRVARLLKLGLKAVGQGFRFLGN